LPLLFLENLTNLDLFSLNKYIVHVEIRFSRSRYCQINKSGLLLTPGFNSGLIWRFVVKIVLRNPDLVLPQDNLECLQSIKKKMTSYRCHLKWLFDVLKNHWFQLLQKPFISMILKNLHKKTLSIMAGYLIFQIFYKYWNWLIESIENHGYES
jgi:hypothetical protein